MKQQSSEKNMMGKLEIVTTEECAFSPARNYNHFKFAFDFNKLVI